MNRRTVLQSLAAAGACTAFPAVLRADTGFDFEFRSIEGDPMPLAQWRGQVLLVVNTASFCGFTPQYEDLVQVWQEYRDRGLVVIGVPSNDFNQERGDEAEIKSFCELTYGVDFPMAEKTAVSGAAAHPFYRWALAETGQPVRWNFNKYLVGRDGAVLAHMPSTVNPTSAKARRAIEAALAAPAG